jgi:hypothetical protein
MKTWHKIVIALAIIGLAVSFYVYQFVYNKSHLDVAHEPAAFTITAKDLYNEFKQNKDASGLKYNGKVIEVSGTVKSIENADTLIVAVFAFEEGMFGDQGVRCTFLDDQKEKVSKIGPGSSLKLKGYCTGFNDSDVIIEKTSIVE